MLDVIDACTKKELKALSNKLFASVKEQGFNPDLVIGIANGGMHVVNEINLDQDIDKLAIKKQRRGTAVKKRLRAKKILPYFPRIFNNLLRKIEVVVREMRYSNKEVPKTTIPLPNEAINRIQSAESILIVDDTLDSGETMAIVAASINQHSSDSATVKTAVINQTFAKPLITADYCLLDRTIIRFPWADDVREPTSQIGKACSDSAN